MMDRFTRSGLYTQTEHRRLNRVRKYKKVHSVGDVLLCDDRQVKPSMLTRAPGVSSREFPIEKPTASDFKLWSQALHAITPQQLHLYHQLGPYTTKPHGPDNWFINSERSQLYQLVSPQSYNIFQRESSSTTTRFGPVYVKTYTQEGTCDNSIRASITPVTLYSVVSSSWFRFHSAAPVYTPPTHHLPLLNH